MYWSGCNTYIDNGVHTNGTLMAKIPLGVRVPPELIELIEKEVSESDLSKAEIVEECIRVRYATQHTDEPMQETEQPTDAVAVDYIQHLKEQLEKRDARIDTLEKVNNEYTGRALNTQTLIEAPAMTKWEHFKSIFR